MGPGRRPLFPSHPVLPDPASGCGNVDDMFGTVRHGSLSFGEELVAHSREIGGTRTGDDRSVQLGEASHVRCLCLGCHRDILEHVELVDHVVRIRLRLVCPAADPSGRARHARTVWSPVRGIL